VNSSTSNINWRSVATAYGVYVFLGGILLGGMAKRGIENARQDPEGLRPLPRSFWVQKTFADADYDIVVAGDSRAYCGLVPSRLVAWRRGARALNLGYPLAGWTEEYCRLIEGKLSRNGMRILVLGVSPYSLTPSAQANPSLRRYLDTPSLEALLVKRLPAIVLWFRPLIMSDLPSWLFGLGPFAPATERRWPELQIPHEDGWIESWGDTVSVDGSVAFYSRIFSKERISDAVLESFAARISIWRSQGIQVFCVRVPASVEVENVEDSLSGFDERMISSCLEKAGGAWITIGDRASYRTYDGSHLFREDALRLSEHVYSDIEKSGIKRAGSGSL
jgi:hypothetical protein